MAIYNQRVRITKTELVDHYANRESLLGYLYGIIRFLGIIVQNIYCISSYLVLSWIVFFPMSWLRSDLYSRVENCLYNSLLFIVSSWSLAAGATIIEAGDEYEHLIEDESGYLDKIITTSGNSLQNSDNKSCNRTNNDNTKDVGQFGGEIGSEANTTATENVSPSVTGSTTSSQSAHLQQVPLQSYTTVSNGAANGPNLSGYNSLKSGHKKPRILLLCNHISTADVPLMMQSFSALTNHSLLWVLDAQFKPTNFGIVCGSHGDFFVAKNSFVDGSLRDQVLKHPDRNLLVLFPEGGFLRKRLDGSNRYALRNNLPQTSYVTHPRFGAFKDLIDPSVGVTHIIDATLLYDDIKNPLSIIDIALGTRKEPVILYHKIYDRRDINPTEEWLRNIWLEKDKLVEKFYNDRNGVYKSFEGTLRAAKLDWFKVLSVHLFYLLVCYLTMYRLISASSSIMSKARDLYYSNI